MDSSFFLRRTERGEYEQIMVDDYEDRAAGEIYRERLDGMTNRTFRLEGNFSGETKKALVGAKANQAPKNDKNAGR